MTSPMETADMEKQGAQGVHFAPQDEEISPNTSIERVETLTEKKGTKRDDVNPDTELQLQQLTTLLKNNMQETRMQHHAFEPVSLPGSSPASRVPSGASTPKKHLRVGSGVDSQKASPPVSAAPSPPLTPAGTKSRDGKQSLSAAQPYQKPSDIVTPQRSTSPHGASGGPTSAAVSSHPRQQPSFSIGPSGDSQPPSKDQSRAGTPASTAPGTPRPATPSEAPTGKRPSTIRHAYSADDKFKFGNRDPSVGYSTTGSTANIINCTLPPTSSAGSISGASTSESKRTSIFGGAQKEHEESRESKSSRHGDKEHKEHHSTLKRFFKIGEHKNHNRQKSIVEESKKASESRDSLVGPSVPFADDHGLQSKYGKFGKILGSGAGGSVRLMKRSGDGVVFAVKQFRDRHPYEAEKDYNKKVTAEFCIGSTLHHGNIIETIDIVHEKGKWYEVMEYAPYDLFATVMTGKMGREEVSCATLQILSGVLYLHNMGLAHRDLKLDNVVINDQGIMKLIDFGSAVVFRYPFENDVVLATGVVGSDPYLAPEVYDQARYDPRMADIWSIAIIFCCMTLRRFPWKAPRASDQSFRLFISPPDPDQEKTIDAQRKSIISARNSVASVDGGASTSEPASRNTSAATDDTDDKSEQHKHHHHHHHEEKKEQSEPVSRQPTQTQADAQPTIKGPLRLLRLLPRETRHIIGRMLEVNPRKRADMDEILQDPWVQNSLVCRQEENGVVIKAPNHTHHLQPSK